MGVDGDFKKILERRNLALYGKRTRYNKNEYKQGMKLLNKKQEEYLKNKSFEESQKHFEIQQKKHEENYLNYLKERGKL